MKGLVLDGGGVFGIGQAHVLAEIDTSVFDFYVGTSIGSVLALALGQQQKDPLMFPEFFHKEMPELFRGDWWRKYKPTAPSFPDKELNHSLQSFLPGSFGDSKKPVYITAANLSTRSLKVFDSTEADDATIPAWEVCRSAVAAETYFDPWEGYGDGGIYANNPSMVAAAEIAQRLGTRLEDLELCSIGTGSVSGVKGGWPKSGSFKLRWGAWLLSSLLDGAANTMHEFFARSLPLAKYRRYDFVRGDGWSMVSPTDMLRAEAKWGGLCSQYAQEIQKEFC